MNLNERETSAVLLGLRLLAEQYEDVYDYYEDMADREGRTPLRPVEIDILRERLNTLPDPRKYEWAFDIVMQLAHEGVLTDEYVDGEADLEIQQQLQEEALGMTQWVLHEHRIWR